MKHGKEKFQDLGKINIVVERKWKIDYIELLRNNKQLLKNNKMAPLTHIENFLLNEEKIDVKTFLALCLLENLHVFHIHKHTFYEIGEENEKENIVIHQHSQINSNLDYDDQHNSSYILKKMDNSCYGYKNAKHEKDLEDVQNNYYKLDSLFKPLKAMTFYKLDHLVEFCKKLHIETTMTKLDKKKNVSIEKNKGKKDLYESLVKYFST
jgi:hypothetical protein